MRLFERRFVKWLLVPVMVCWTLFARPGITGQENGIVSISVDLSRTQQSFIAWSAFLGRWDAPHMYYGPGTGPPLNRVPGDVRERILDLLFTDLKLNAAVVALNGGLMDPSYLDAPANWRSHEPENDNADPNSFNFSRLNFSYWPPLLKNVEGAFQRIRARGETPRLFLRVSRREHWMNHVARFEEEYAEWILALILYLRKDHNLMVDYVSVVNEPDGNAISPEQLSRIIVVFDARRKALGLSTRVAGPETVTPFAALDYLNVMKQKGALSDLGLISYHLYDYDASVGEKPPLSPRRSIRDFSIQNGIPAFMGEQGSDVKANRRTFWLDTPEQSLALANDFVTEFTVTGASGMTCCMWTFWTDSSPNFGSDAFVVLDFDESENYRFLGYRKARQYEVLGRFIKNIRPGMIRVATVSDDSKVRSVAFLDPAGNRLALVVVNNSANAREVRFMNGLGGSVAAQGVRAFSIPLTR